MCGIVGYIGPKEACPILINGLKRLEYRGYDSAGVALLHEGNIEVYKCKGRVLDLENHLENHDTRAHLGMGHTRWATHGEPNDINAHPHTSTNGVFSIVHNGIIENHALLKEKLQARGYTFKSETDTEVLANLIEYIYLKGNIDAEMAVRLALAKVIGAYGLVVMCKNEPDKLIVARKGSPLVIGVGQGEYFVASDATPIVEYTKNVIYLNDDDVAILKRDEMILKTIKNTPVSLSIQQVDIDINKIEKGGFPHFMLKEIFEQVNSIYDTIRGRVNVDASEIYLGGISEIIPKMINARRIIIIGCGTSWHAGLVGEHMIESLARIPVEVEYASEFRYRIVNVLGSSIARETDAGVYTHAGPEIGVASTKAFTAQISVLIMMALQLGHRKGTISDELYQKYIHELYNLPDKVKNILEENAQIKEIAATYKDATNAIYLGRGCQFPVALEGALKLKEISYIHAEGYPAAEMKHGPIALIDEHMPVFAIAMVFNQRYFDLVCYVSHICASSIC